MKCTPQGLVTTVTTLNPSAPPSSSIKVRVPAVGSQDKCGLSQDRFDRSLKLGGVKQVHLWCLLSTSPSLGGSRTAMLYIDPWSKAGMTVTYCWSLVEYVWIDTLLESKLDHPVLSRLILDVWCIYIYTFNALFDPLSSLSYIDCRGSANLEMKQFSWRIWFWFPGPCYIVGCSARDMMPFGGRDWRDGVFRWAVSDRTWMRLSAQRMLCIYIYIFFFKCMQLYTYIGHDQWFLYDWLWHR